jgi:hypothetical protein
VGCHEAGGYHHSMGGLMGEGEAVGWCTGLNGVGEAAARRWPCAATAWSKDGGGEEVGPGGPAGLVGQLACLAGSKEVG